MTATAVIMMVVAIATVWGGLIVSIVHLAKHPEADDDSTMHVE